MREPRDENGADQLTLTDHLAELRTRIIRSLYALVIGVGIAFYFSSLLFDVVREPVAQFLPEGGLVFTHPMDKFVAHFKLAGVAGLIMTCPFWLYQAWCFVAPGLYRHERKYAMAFIVSSSALFVIGACFAYFLVLPAAFDFLFSFGGSTDKPLITISEYFSFFATMVLVFAVCFELPVIMVILGLLGILKAKGLRSTRRYAIVVMSIVSAVVTPPDILSMIFLFVPLLILYEISIVLIDLIERRRAAAASIGAASH